MVRMFFFVVESVRVRPTEAMLFVIVVPAVVVMVKRRLSLLSRVIGEVTNHAVKPFLRLGVSVRVTVTLFESLA